MVGYLGAPPLEYLRRSEVTNDLFDEKGQSAFELCPACLRSDGLLGRWKGAGGVAVPEMSLERAEVVLEGTKEKGQFLDFMRSMLRWLPEERRRPAELLSHPWFINY